MAEAPSQPITLNRQGEITQEDGKRWAMIVIAIIASVAMLVISATAKLPKYHFNFVFLVPLLWLGYWQRRPLGVTPATFAAYALALLLHDLGAYGFYQHSPLPWSWDIYVHYFFGIVGSLVLRGALAQHFPSLRPWQLNLTTLLFVMGIGALHEIMEYVSYLIGGTRYGMLDPEHMYFFDTQRDLTNNLLGCLTALVLRSLVALLSARRSRHA
jgi:uncharacterized membrane protein YjdF